jgi:hypothetical protein
LNGLTLPESARVNDLGIPDVAKVWRMVDPRWMEQPWGQEISSGAFKTHELSVYLRDEVTLAWALQQHPGFSVAELEVGFLRSLSLIIARDPAIRGHCLVYRSDRPGLVRISAGAGKKMAMKARTAFVYVAPRP